jgi:hypothetical protein
MKKLADNALHYEVPQRARLKEFVKYWHGIYRDKNEQLYFKNIGKKLTPVRMRELYFWKNGGPLSALKRKSVEVHYISRLPKIADAGKLEAKDWLKQFGHGRAIWDIFFLHVWNQKFPIFDQHVYRAMKFIQKRELCELPTKESEKTKIYLEEYLPFFQAMETELRSSTNRKLDKALWRFGKFLKWQSRN